MRLHWKRYYSMRYSMNLILLTVKVQNHPFNKTILCNRGVKVTGTYRDYDLVKFHLAACKSQVRKQLNLRQPY